MTIEVHKRTPKEKLSYIAQQLETVRAKEDALKLLRINAMMEAYKEGMTYQEIGDLLGVTKAYVHQQIKKVKEQTVE